jgi:hypothetical protein
LRCRSLRATVEMDGDGDGREPLGFGLNWARHVRSRWEQLDAIFFAGNSDRAAVIDEECTAGVVLVGYSTR